MIVSDVTSRYLKHRETIRAWGDRGAAIIQEIEAVHFSDAYYYPVPELDDEWDCFPFAIVRAHVASADGTKFKGYLTDPSVGVFFEEDDFCFNANLEDWAESALERLRQATGRNLDPFFPVYYRTDGVPRPSEGFFGYGDQVSKFLLKNHGFDLQGGDLVRVADLRFSTRKSLESGEMRRQPRVGDVGRVLGCLDPALHELPFQVACIDRPKDFYETVWHVAFAADELELVSRK